MATLPQVKMTDDSKKKRYLFFQDFLRHDQHFILLDQRVQLSQRRRREGGGISTNSQGTMPPQNPQTCTYGEMKRKRHRKETRSPVQQPSPTEA